MIQLISGNDSSFGTIFQVPLNWQDVCPSAPKIFSTSKCDMHSHAAGVVMQSCYR